MHTNFLTRSAVGVCVNCSYRSFCVDWPLQGFPNFIFYIFKYWKIKRDILNLNIFWNSLAKKFFKPVYMIMSGRGRGSGGEGRESVLDLCCIYCARAVLPGKLGPGYLLFIFYVFKYRKTFSVKKYFVLLN